MKRISHGKWFAAVGTIVLLVGLVFLGLSLSDAKKYGDGNLSAEEVFALLSTPFIAIGASIVAAGSVELLRDAKRSSKLLETPIGTLSGHSPFTRIKQEVELVFVSDGEGVVLEKNHRFHLRNEGAEDLAYGFMIFTDTISWATGGAPVGGNAFHKVLGPDGVVLSGAKLKGLTRHQDGKEVFVRKYHLRRGDANPFELHSKTSFRKVDRLVWTIQDLSDGFRIRIFDKTGSDRDSIEVKINHPAGDKILKVSNGCRRVGDDWVYEYDIDGLVLPYQGFEVMWRLI